jgi:hypothetical protein
MTETKYEPCPFCGGQPQMESVTFKGKLMFCLACNNIECLINPVTPFCLNRGAAKRMWNGRQKNEP